MTVQEAIDYGVTVLSTAHTHDPQGCAQFLLRHALQKTMQERRTVPELLLVAPDLPLTSSCAALFEEMIDRRRRHEPVWYITNEAYFWKDCFYVDERVLIPRPETELLVESVLREIRQRIEASTSKRDDSRVAMNDFPLSIVDVGTGCGAIAISLAKELARSIPVRMYATDISEGAIQVAKENARRLGVAGKICFLVGDALETLTEAVDFIVGNPPYIPTETVGGLALDIHHFEPRLALDGGPDGLTVHRKILSKAAKLLKTGGSIFLEIGYDQAHIVRAIARRHFPLARIEILQDYQGHDRIVVVQTYNR